jgi:hypothetical protein
MWLCVGCQQWGLTAYDVNKVPDTDVAASAEDIEGWYPDEVEDTEAYAWQDTAEPDEEDLEDEEEDLEDEEEDFEDEEEDFEDEEEDFEDEEEEDLEPCVVAHDDCLAAGGTVAQCLFEEFICEEAPPCLVGLLTCRELGLPLSACQGHLPSCATNDCVSAVQVCYALDLDLTWCEETIAMCVEGAEAEDCEFVYDFCVDNAPSAAPCAPIMGWCPP